MVRYVSNYIESVKNIKKRYCPQNDPFYAKYFFRPLSFLISPLFIKLKLSGNLVTFLGAITGCLALFFFILGSHNYWRYGAVVFLLTVLLDFVDGTICRETDSTSFFGKFFDGMIDTLVFTPLPVCMGIGLHTVYNNKLFIYAGIIATFLYLFAAVTMSKYSFIANWIEITYLEKNNEKELKAFKENVNKYRKGHSNNYVINFLLLSFLIMTVFDFRIYVFGGLTILYSIWASIFSITQFLKAYKLFNIKRKSIHSNY
jgi:phosphatidylglycerophosphate synthase